MDFKHQSSVPLEVTSTVLGTPPFESPGGVVMSTVSGQFHFEQGSTIVGGSCQSSRVSSFAKMSCPAASLKTNVHVSFDVNRSPTETALAVQPDELLVPPVLICPTKSYGFSHDGMPFLSANRPRGQLRQFGDASGAYFPISHIVQLLEA